MIPPGTIEHWLLYNPTWWPESGVGYAIGSSWSGSTAILSGAYIIAKRHNCHEHGCWRIGRVLLPDGTLTCHRHDPRTAADKPQPGHVRACWEAHLARLEHVR